MPHIKKLEEQIREHAYALSNLLEEANNVDPVASVQIYKGIMQYLSEKTTIRKDGIFTIGELEEMGYMPTV